MSIADRAGVAALAASLLVIATGGACSQRWTFAPPSIDAMGVSRGRSVSCVGPAATQPPDAPASQRNAANTAAPDHAARASRRRDAAQRRAESPAATSGRPACARGACRVFDPPAAPGAWVQPASYAEVRRLPPVEHAVAEGPAAGRAAAAGVVPAHGLPAGGGVLPNDAEVGGGGDVGPAFAPPGESSLGQLSVREACPSETGCVGSTLRRKLRRAGRDIWRDHCHYYSWPTLRDLALALAVTAPLANTSLDEDFQYWVQDDVRCDGTDNYATFWKTFGEGEIFIPAFAGLAVACKTLEECPIPGSRLFGAAGEYSWRVARGYLVGGPPMLFMQALTGGSRPGEARVGSQWKPFDDTNGVSGHAFMGAVPFITAARMVDRPLMKCGLYVMSTHTAWSRVNDDDHYLSQICLGWWMAYLACRAVEETADEARCVALMPMAGPEFSGVAMVVRR